MLFIYDKKTLRALLIFFISRVYQPLRLTLVDRFHPFLRFSLANFRRLSSPFVSKTQKLPSRTRRPKKELRSQKKKKQPSFLPHKEQKTSSVSKQNAVAHVYQPHGTFIAFLFSSARMWFQSADFAFAFGLPVAVLSRVICELNFFSIAKSGLAALFQAPVDFLAWYNSAAASVFGLAKLSERIERCFREETISFGALRSFSRWFKGCASTPRGNGFYLKIGRAPRRVGKNLIT